MEGPSLLGFADVKVVLSNEDAKKVDTNEFVPLVAGRILPILFRIEQGAAGPPSITIDATALSAPTVTLSGTGTFAPTSAQTFLLMPGSYDLIYNAGVRQPRVTFDVTPAGLLDFASALDGVLAGRGTRALSVAGRTVQVDVSALSAPVFDINYVRADQPSSAVLSLTLLPGEHAILYNAGVSQPSATFSVTPGGTVDYASVLGGVLSGRGTGVLKVDGRTIWVDATTLDIATFTLAFNGSFPAASVQALTLLPGAHHIAAATRDFDFEVGLDGAVSYDSGLYPFLGGLGTSLLSIQPPS